MPKEQAEPRRKTIIRDIKEIHRITKKLGLIPGILYHFLAGFYSISISVICLR